MTATDTAANRHAVKQLEALATELQGRGFTVTTTLTGTYPGVRVVNRSMSILSEDIYAAPATSGRWFLWWSWSELVAVIDDIDAAATKITHVLNPTGDHPQQPATDGARPQPGPGTR